MLLVELSVLSVVKDNPLLISTLTMTLILRCHASGLSQCHGLPWKPFHTVKDLLQCHGPCWTHTVKGLVILRCHASRLSQCHGLPWKLAFHTVKDLLWCHGPCWTHTVKGLVWCHGMHCHLMLSPTVMDLHDYTTFHLWVSSSPNSKKHYALAGHIVHLVMYHGQAYHDGAYSTQVWCDHSMSAHRAV